MAGRDGVDVGKYSVSETFRVESDELGRWPYTLHAINETLDHTLISERGKQLMFQAMNNRTLVAFIGSGTSQSYGRLSWDSWLTTQLGLIANLASAYLGCSRASRELLFCQCETASSDNGSVVASFLQSKLSEIDFHLAETESLAKTFMQLKGEGPMLGGERHPIVFEVAEQLQEMLKRNERLFLSRKGLKYLKENKINKVKFEKILSAGVYGFNPNQPTTPAPESAYKSWIDKFKNEFASELSDYEIALEKYYRVASLPGAEFSVNDMAKVLLVDECAHAEQILLEGVEYSDEMGRENWNWTSKKEHLVNDTDFTKRQIKAIENTNFKIRGMSSSTSVDNLKRGIEGIRSVPERYWSLGFFKTASVMNLASRVEEYLESAKCDNPAINKNWAPVLNLLAQQFEKNQQSTYGAVRNVERHFISPTHRFIWKMMLNLVEDPYESLKDWKTEGNLTEITKLDKMEPSSDGAFFFPVKKGDFRSRLSIGEEDLDPIAKLAKNLGVHQFLTTNYDFEIERNFQDRGYVKFTDDGEEDDLVAAKIRRQSPNSFRVNGLGGILRDRSFQRLRASDLIVFSSGHDNADASVFHLHGRATPESELVITERNYMDLYLRNDRHRDVVDEGMRVAFSANPIVFLGLGMKEEDLLRPLRQFMSDRDPTSSRTTIALLAADLDETARVKTSAALYVRYGVHAVYYGMGWVNVLAAGGGECKSEPVEIDWLYRVTNLIRVLRDINQTVAKGTLASLRIQGAQAKLAQLEEEEDKFFQLREIDQLEAEIEEAKKTLNLDHDARLGVIEKALEGDEKPTFGRPILDVLVGKVLGDQGRAEALFEYFDVENWSDSQSYRLAECHFEKLKKHRDFGDDGQPSDVYLSFEYGLLAQLLVMTLNLSKMNWNETGTDKYISGQRALLRDLNARITALDSLGNAILTATTCAALDNLEREREEWWNFWQMSPPYRIPKFEEKPPRLMSEEIQKPETYVSMPTKFIRHELDNVITMFPEDESGQIKWTNSVRSAPNTAVTGVRAFDTFLNAIETRSAFDCENGANGLGRRFHCVAAHRGLGKGSFLSAFSSSRGLCQYIASSWNCGKYIVSPDYLKTQNFPPRVARRFRNKFVQPDYQSAIFVNLSFSTELASAYDMLVDALIKAVEQVMPCKKGGKGTKNTDLASELRQLPRIRKIERLFHLFGNACRKQMPEAVKNKNVIKQPRLLLCLNAIGLMHYADGLVKNREIEEFLRFLTSTRTENIPFDLILVTSETAMSEFLARETPFTKRYDAVIKRDTFHDAGNYTIEERDLPLFMPLTRDDIDAQGIQNIHRREKASFIDFGDNYTDPKPGKMIGAKLKEIGNTSGGNFSIKDSTDHVCFVYHARVMRPEQHLVDNFFPLAALLYTGFALSEIKKIGDVNAYSDLIKKFEFEKFRISTKKRGKVWSDDNENWLRNWNVLKEDQNKAGRKAFEFFCNELRGILRKKNEKSLLKKLGLKNPITDENLNKLLIDRYNSKNTKTKIRNQAFREWREIRGLLSGNRYCMTILLAAAQKIAFAGRDAQHGATRAESFIRETINQVKMVRLDRVEETVLQCVLNSYEQFNQIGNLAHDAQLHALILRHIAVIGAPCSADVLVRTPDIRRYFDSLVEDDPRRRETRLVEALTELVERGLVFRIQPHPRLIHLFKKLGCRCSKIEMKINEKEQKHEVAKRALESATDECRDAAAKKCEVLQKEIDGLVQAFKEEDKKRCDIFGAGFTENDAKLTFRYALHRLVQRHVALKMNSGPREFIEINSFSPSLFASMPSDLPRLNMEAYNFLNGLLDSLSQFPDHPSGLPGAENWHFGSASISTQAQALRGALAVARSTFSIAVVSRFDDYKTLASRQEIPKRGYFEQYRIQIRWLLRKAFELLHEDVVTSGYRADNDDRDHINAFYRDEIVWLYNECGVINLVQGNVRDAVALFRQAIKINRDIEGQLEGGAQHNRISLNLAIAQIERGRLSSAKKRLQSICESETLYSVRKGRIWHIAYGYLGVIHRINGDLDEAARHYKKAVAILRVYDDSRACAIFCRHHGEMERERHRFKQAQYFLEEALAFAEAGGHEDISKRTRLSFIDLSIRQSRVEQSHLDIPKTLAELQVIEDYARIMAMPSLQCDVKLIHASLMMEDGETSLAGRLLSHTITIAKRNEMSVRLNAALTSYGKVLGMRNLYTQANAMLFTSLEMAKRCSNQLEIERIEKEFHRLHGR